MEYIVYKKINRYLKKLKFEVFVVKKISQLFDTIWWQRCTNHISDGSFV